MLVAAHGYRTIIQEYNRAPLNEAIRALNTMRSPPGQKVEAAILQDSLQRLSFLFRHRPENLKRPDRFFKWLLLDHLQASANHHPRAPAVTRRLTQ